VNPVLIKILYDLYILYNFMSMRAITPILAILVLLLMTIAGGALAYMTILSYKIPATEASQAGADNLAASSNNKLKIESVSDGVIYLRNLGEETFTSVTFYINGRPLNTTGPEVCGAGKTCAYAIAETLACTNEGRLDMGTDLGMATKTVVPCEELGPQICGDAICNKGEDTSTCPQDCCSTSCDNSCSSSSCFGYDPDCDAGGGTTAVCCGDLECDGSEGCLSCQTDCGVCPLTLNLENSTEWSNSQWTHGYAADVDNDSTVEILTIEPSTGLRVWNRTGGTINLEASASWGSGKTPRWVYAANIDSDPALEILTCGYDTSLDTAEIKIWNKTGDALYLENTTTWTSGTDPAALSIYAANVDSDPEIEVITAGYIDLNEPTRAQLRVWDYTNGNLILQNTTDWIMASHTQAFSVYAEDVDADGVKEIITIGRGWAGTRYNAQLIIWNNSNGNLNIEDSYDWYTTGDSYGYDVYAANIDSDLAVEILTAGSSNFIYRAQLYVWNITNGQITPEDHQEWYQAASQFHGAMSVYAADIDNDAVVEVLTGSQVHDGTRTNAEVRVWNHTNNLLSVENTNRWYTGGDTYLDSIYAVNLDADSDLEIITTGRNPSSSELRIWNYTQLS
jgi:flagellin-like protein